MHARIHVRIVHALRDSKLTLVKLTCPPSEEVNSLNGKECLSSTLWWHPLFPSVTLWEIITQVHSCLPENWIWAAVMAEGVWGEALQTAYSKICKRAQMCRARHILAHFEGISGAVFVSHVSYTQVDIKRGNEDEDLIKAQRDTEDRPCRKHKEKCVDQY